MCGSLKRWLLPGIFCIILNKITKTNNAKPKHVAFGCQTPDSHVHFSKTQILIHPVSVHKCHYLSPSSKLKPVLMNERRISLHKCVKPLLDPTL